MTEPPASTASPAEADARTSAIIDAALDCIIMMDAAGRVVEFNPAAERTFFYRREDAVGRELAELIVPERLRERHRKGLAHYLATGEGPVIGRRVEMPALRADGTEFPVELTITRIAGERVLFTAYLRDIGARVRAEQLRNARFAATQALAQAGEITPAAAAVLQAVREHLQWEFGALWRPRGNPTRLRCEVASARSATGLEQFEAATHSESLRPGEGLPGRVWESGAPAWILDVRGDTNFVRRRVAASSGVKSAFAYPVATADRKLGVLEFFAQSLREPDAELLETIGTIAGHLGQFIERREAEQRLRESEERFRAMTDQAPYSMQIFSRDGRTMHVNPAWSRLWGVTLEDIADYNVLEDPQLEKKGVLAHLRRAFAGEGAVALPLIRYDPNETIPDRSRNADPVRYVAGVAYPLKDEAGEVREVVLVHEDVTARRQAESALQQTEEKFRLLAETIPQLAWMARPDGNIFWYNQRWYEYTGTTPRDMEGWGWQSVHDPEVLPQVVERWTASLASGETFDMIFPIRGADGLFRPFLTRVNPLRDPQGAILYWFGTNTDVSDIKRLEAALRDADRRKDEFLAMLAHELRNPLAPIRNALQILQMPQVDARMAGHAREVMERQLQHLVRLVDDLLDVSRVIRGKIELRRQPVDLATAVAHAVETVQPLVKAHGQRLDVALPAEPLLIDGDPVRLSQVLGNLLHNAAKYTEPGGSISLTARREGEQVSIQVKDSGLGIAPDALPHIFELFVQGEQSSARSQGGLGIGLTLVKELVERHGGSVRAHSAGIGRGSEFTVVLPLHAAGDETRLAPGNPTLAAAGATRRCRLMVIDDNEDAAQSLAALLAAHGHDVRVALDGASGLALAQDFRPELVFLDLGMPGLDGYEVVRRARAIRALDGTLFVALTGWGQDQDRRRSAAAGFDHHLVKPPEWSELCEIIEQVARGERRAASTSA